MGIGEQQIARQVTQAWQQARNAGCTGRYLDAVLQKALSVRRRVRRETTLGSHFVSAANAAVQLAGQIFGSLAQKNVIVIGAGHMGEMTVRTLIAHGAQSVSVIGLTLDEADQLLRRANTQSAVFRACAFEDRWQPLAAADLVISAAAAPAFIFVADDMHRLAVERKGRKLVLIDLALPRNVDPAVRAFEGVLLYDLEDLERAVELRPGTRPGEAEAEKIIAAEVQGFRKQLMAESVGPELTALRSRLDQICRQELESFRLERGPFFNDPDRLIAAVSNRIARKIAGSLARDLKACKNPAAPNE